MVSRQLNQLSYPGGIEFFLHLFLQRPETKDEIMFQYCFPRLDVNVTKGLNHLLKSPFCVHPKTGQLFFPATLYSAPLTNRWEDFPLKYL